MNDSIGWSKFAKHRHKKGMGFSYFDGTDEELKQLIYNNWNERKIGNGAESINDVCIVSVPPDKFVCTTVKIEDDLPVTAKITRRQPQEHPFIKNEAVGTPVETKFAKVVLYASHELLKNGGERSCDADWEIICIIASPVENEPMHPLIMSRNMLEKPGGTKRTYTAQELAESIWYWSKYVALKAENE